MKEMNDFLSFFNFGTVLYLFGKLVLIELIIIGVALFRSLIPNLIFQNRSSKDFKDSKRTTIFCIVLIITCIAIFCFISNHDNIFINIFLLLAIICLLLFKRPEKVCISSIIASSIVIILSLDKTNQISGIGILFFAFILILFSIIPVPYNN